MALESIDILIQRAQVLRTRNVDQAMSLLDDALSIAQQANYKPGMAMIIRDKAACYFIQKNYKRSITAYNEAIQFFRDLKDIENQKNCICEISSIYFKLGDCPSALKYILENLKLNTEQGDSEGIGHNYNELGKIYIYIQFLLSREILRPIVNCHAYHNYSSKKYSAWQQLHRKIFMIYILNMFPKILFSAQVNYVLQIFIHLPRYNGLHDI